jgi:hypothetical protein
MYCTFHAYLLNDNYSQEHADAQHGGNESENNRKYLWEDELRIKTVIDEVKLHENSIYTLKGEYPKGNYFEYDVPGMLLYEFKIKGEESVLIGASSQIIENHSIERNEVGYTLKFFLKDNEPFSDPVPGIYIASKSFPKALVF